MKPFTLTIRAIGSQLAMRLYLPAVLTIAILIALVIAGGLWLTTLNDWWWLLFFPITVLVSVAIGIAAVVFFLIRYVRPDQTKAQKRAVGQFVDKLQGVVDVAGTPKFIILFRVIRSIAAPSKDTYLADIAKNKQLGSDFRELQRMFDQRA